MSCPELTWPSLLRRKNAQSYRIAVQLNPHGHYPLGFELAYDADLHAFLASPF